MKGKTDKPTYQEFATALTGLLKSLPKQQSYTPVLIWGPSDYLVTRSTQAVRDLWCKTMGQAAYQAVAATDLSEEDLQTQLEQQNLFHEASACVIKSCEKDTNVFKHFFKLHRSGPLSNLLVFCYVGERLGPKVKSSFHERAAVVIPCFEPRKAEFPRFVASLAKKQKLLFTTDGIETLLEAVGQDLFKIDNELQKIGLIFPDRTTPLRGADIAPYLGLTREDHAFQLTDHILSGQIAKAQALLMALLGRGESPLAILGILSRLCRQAIQISALSSKGTSPRQIAAEVRLPLFVVGSYNKFIARKSPLALDRALLTCQSVDSSLKSTPMSGELLLSRLLCDLA